MIEIHNNQHIILKAFERRMIREPLQMTKSEHGEIKGPLDGVKILEYGVFHAGPGASAILGDLGASVIKIEEEKGDPERYWTKVGGIDISGPRGQSFMFEISNRNKKDICLDISTPEGAKVFEKLVAGSDVFLTNLRKSTKSKMGLDYESLKKINPDIIHANVSGYGPEGPVSDMGAFDPMGQARSGMMFLHDSGQPSLIHLAILDQATAICASHAILTALFYRERHGKGQEVHSSLYGSGLWLMYTNLIMTSVLNVDPSINWVRSQNSPLRNNFVCKDGKWIIAVHHPEEKYWPGFCRAAGLTELIDDPRFCDAKNRRKNNAELVEIFDEVMAAKPRDEWLELLAENGLMFTPVYRMVDVINDVQAMANNYVVEFQHPDYGRIKIPGYPSHFSDCSAGTTSPAPDIGQHTDDILRDLGYGNDEIQDLKARKIVKS